jgi:hypothetical protein
LSIELSNQETTARALLIRVARNAVPNTAFPRLIGYKDFWGRVSDRTWSRSCVKEIIGLITKVSAYEIQHSRPMLNELVVNVSGEKRGIPGEPLNRITKYLRDEFEVEPPPYESHIEAQRACWAYWGKEEAQSNGVVEGELEDRTITFRKRNAKIILQRKKLDKYTCQACFFRLKLGTLYIIDCHHLYPFRSDSAARVTSLDDLVCLCPTCHRIAHVRWPQPLSIEEILSARSKVEQR